MGDKDKRSAFTTVVMSDIENNTQAVVYNSYTLPLLIYNGTDMSKNIEKIEAVPDKGITIQNGIVFYDNTYEDANSTFEFVMITLNELEGSQTHSLAELIEDGFTITPFISGDGGGGSSDFSTAKVTLINSTADNYTTNLNVPCILNEEEFSRGTDFPDPGSDMNIGVVIYKGTPTYAIAEFSGVTDTTTGNVRRITLDQGVATFEITGDGSITISDMA